MQSMVVLPAGSTKYLLHLTEASTDYTIGVRYVDPRGCTSATTTVSATTDVSVCLEPPTGLSPFADGKGTYGVECTATVVPGGVEVWVATETAVDSGVAGTYSLQDTVPALLDPLRTRWTVTAPAPNDRLLRFIKVQSAQAGYTACGFSAVVTIDPWTLVEPTNPDDKGEPSTVPGLAAVWTPIPLFRSGTLPHAILQPGATREVLASDRGMEEYPDLSGVVSAYLTAGFRASELPVGTYIACEFETPDAPGDWHPLEDSTEDTAGPAIMVDPDSLDAADPNTDEAAFTVLGAAIEVRPEAAQQVRVRAVIGGGDSTAAAFLTFVTLWVLVGSLVDVPVEIDDPETEDPGSCDTPGDLISYADQATAFAAEPED